VLAVDPVEVLVATGSGSLSLRGFADLRGNELDPVRAAGALDLTPGVVLDLLAPELIGRLTELDRSMSRAERHWVQRLSEVDPITLPIPASGRVADGKRVARPTVLDVPLPAELALRFPDHPVSHLLTAAFVAYLARLGRRGSFDLGYGDAEIDRQIEGQTWIASRLPVRIDVDLEEGLTPLVQRVAAELIDARAHGPWLWDLIARHPELRALQTRTEALFPVAVQRCEVFSDPESTEGAPWTLEVRDGSDAVAGACRFVYDAELVSSANAASFQAGFSALLASLSANPNRRLAAHAMASAEELDRQQEEWNRTALPHRREVCVHDLFAEQVARTPEAVALVCGAISLTYAELDARSDRLAAVLVQRGVRAGQLVGIFLERSVDLVVAVLGTLKAGGAYVPLDPTHPPSRNAVVMDDAQPPVVLTQRHLRDRVQPPAGTFVLCLDDPWDSDYQDRVEPPAVTVDPAQLAYVIFTSGSTGRPKGVQVPRGALANFLSSRRGRNWCHGRWSRRPA
jgi:non-ribosomal peptide synthetase component F